ncbi:MAG: hypothetical protein QM695_08805 [Micropruina sp.]
MVSLDALLGTIAVEPLQTLVPEAHNHTTSVSSCDTLWQSSASAHTGSHQFTVGQRRGLHLGVPAADGRPRYVLGIEPAGNRVVVGPHEALAVGVIDGIRPSWAEQPAYGPWRGLVQVRAHGEPLPATIDGRPDGITVTLDTPAHSIAPGQAVVCYDGNRVVGSATIASGIPAIQHNRTSTSSTRR